MKTMKGLLLAALSIIVTGLRSLVLRAPRTPVTVKFSAHPWVQRGHGKTIAGGSTWGGMVVGWVRAMLGLVTPRTVLLAALVLTLVLVPDGASGVLVANAAVASLSDESRTKLKEHDRIVAELAKAQEEYAGKPMPEGKAAEWEEMAKTAEALYEEVSPELDRVEQLAEAQGRTRRGKALSQHVGDPTLPDEPRKGSVAGYVTLGTFVALNERYQKYAESGASKGMAPPSIEVNAEILGSKAKMHNGQALIPLTREQRQKIEDTLHELKAVPTIGAGVIEPDRLDRLPQVTADDELTLRDVMSVTTTQSDSVSYVREESFTRSAAETAHGSAKPEGTGAYTEQTSTVRTIAAWMPVQTQQLADWMQLRGLIDGRLRYDLSKREEEQFIYGSGAGVNLEGLEKVSGTTDISALTRYVSSTHTLIDVARMGITEVRKAGYRPNAILIDPVDWESIIIQKGSDNHYVWVIVTDENGQRLWSLRVVESVAMEENAGNPTEQRNMIVGDYMAGCQIVDRMAATVMVGVQNDDFVKNLRTILAEERLAFPIYAPAAFAKFETQALAT